MCGSITVDGQTYEFYDRTDLMNYLTKNCKGIIRIVPYLFKDLVQYKDTFLVIDDLDGNAVGISYDKRDKEKVQAIIELIKKWDYCGAKKGAFCIEYETKFPTKFHLWPKFCEFDSVIIICSGLFEKDYYIKRYTDGTNFTITDL